MAGSSNPVPDRTFEQEKWKAEVRLRRRELDIKEQEQRTKDAEVQAKIHELERSRWTSPLVLAILAVAFALAGNIAVQLVNGAAQRALEGEISKAQATHATYSARVQQLSQISEEVKAESARILEAIKTTDPDKAAVNLQFLLDAGLIINKERKAALTTVLSRRQSGEGPYLPLPSLDEEGRKAAPTTVLLRRQPREEPYLPLPSPQEEGRRRSELELASTFHKCKLKSEQNFDDFINAFSNAIREIGLKYRVENRNISLNEKEIIVETGEPPGGPKTLYLYLEFKYDDKTHEISTFVRNQGPTKLSDEQVLSNPTAARFADVMPALTRRSLRSLVGDPSCVGNSTETVTKR